MAIVVVGGHTRNIGKTAVVAALIARMPEMRWTAMKISQHGHGTDRDDMAADGTAVISVEQDRGAGTDSSRFLQAGALRSLWVRTKRARLAEAMPEVSKEISRAENVIIESNSVLEFLTPDVFLSVLDYGVADFKRSAMQVLDRADAILLRAGERDLPLEWPGDPLKLIEGKPVFEIAPPEYMTDAVAMFVRERVCAANARSIALATASGR